MLLVYGIAVTILVYGYNRTKRIEISKYLLVYGWTVTSADV